MRDYLEDDVVFLQDVQSEIGRARKKFPENKHKLAALMEEVGELANAMLEHDTANPDVHVFPVSVNDIWDEAVQVAAMAARVAIEGDASFRHGGS